MTLCPGFQQFSLYKFIRYQREFGDLFFLPLSGQKSEVLYGFRPRLLNTFLCR